MSRNLVEFKSSNERKGKGQAWMNRLSIRKAIEEYTGIYRYALNKFGLGIFGSVHECM